MYEFLSIIANGETLTRDEARGAMTLLMEGEASPEHTAAFLMGLRSRGETVEELVGFTEIMREFAVKVDHDDPHAIDLCGTGGDGSGTFNISTTASFVAAGAGVTVAKHGNRSVSSTCGSADVLEALGVNIDLQKEGVEHCLTHAGIAFLFAPFFHPAMRHVMPVRRELGVRTFFNILGPLCNPAGVKRQLVGAFDTETARIMADILAALDAEHVITVHARDGLDEISLSAPTALFEHQSDQESEPDAIVIEPKRYGYDSASIEQLKGGTLDKNVAILKRVLDGEAGPQRDIVELNAAFALYTSGKFDGLDACFDAARESINSGAARNKLDDLVNASKEAA